MKQILIILIIFANSCSKQYEVHLHDQYSGVGYIVIDSTLIGQKLFIADGHLVKIAPDINPNLLMFYRGNEKLSPEFIVERTNTYYIPLLKKNQQIVTTEEMSTINKFYIAKDKNEIHEFQTNRTKKLIEIGYEEDHVLDSLITYGIIK